MATTGFYASPNRQERSDGLQDILELGEHADFFYIVARGFNSLIFYDGKRGERHVMSSQTRELYHIMTICDLEPLPMSSTRYSWNNKYYRKDNVQELLDYVLINSYWIH